jgi:hypothetical protein
MELETNSVRTKQFRTKPSGYNPLTKPQIEVHNAIHSYTKLLTNRENSGSTRSTATLIPIKTTAITQYDGNYNNFKVNSKLLPNRVNNDAATITTINNNNVKQINEMQQKIIKMNSNNSFIYQIPPQHRILNNISSISDQTYNMAPLTTNHLQVLNDENKLSKLRSRTSQSSAKTNQTVSTTQKYQTQKKPIKLNPITKPITNNKQNEHLEFIALHKPLQQKSMVISKPIDINESLNKYNKLTLFDSNNKFINTKTHQQHLQLQKPNKNSKVNYKWTFNNSQTQQHQQQEHPSDILTSIFKGDKIIVDNFKINKLIQPKRNTIVHLDDIDEDYMDGIYNSKSILDKLNQSTPKIVNKQPLTNNSSELTPYIDSDTDTLVSNSSLLSTSDKSCEIIYSCPVNQKLQEERRKRAQIRKYKSRLNNLIKPEDMFYNNATSSDEDINSSRDTKNTNVKNVKKNILTSLNKRLSANSNLN